MNHRPATYAPSYARDGEALVKAKAVAAYLGVDVSWVYAHADELGARRLGSGPKARLRFSLIEVDSRLTACVAGRESNGAGSAMVEPKPRRRRRSGSGSGVELLPIRGSRGPS
jgi:hypothetical protein